MISSRAQLEALHQTQASLQQELDSMHTQVLECCRCALGLLVGCRCMIHMPDQIITVWYMAPSITCRLASGRMQTVMNRTS